jgi:hypothetical protein
VPANAKVQDMVELPDPVTLVGLTAHAVLLVANATTPAKPFCAEIVTVEVPELPAFTVTIVGLTVMVKS